MLKLSKKVEYALLSVQVMAERPDEIVSAKDVAERYGISNTLVAKVMQQLVHAGIIRSYQGVRGGYMLDRPAHEVTVMHVIAAIEGRQAGIVDCQEQADHDCQAFASCTIKGPLQVLNDRIASTFESMSLADLVHRGTSVPVTMELPVHSY
jgi:Rrf2 family protein